MVLGLVLLPDARLILMGNMDTGLELRIVWGHCQFMDNELVLNFVQ